MTVTMNRELNERMGWYTYMVRVNDIVVCGSTDETGEAAANRFFELCKENEAELNYLCSEAEHYREVNMSDSSKAKDWPAFKARERFVDKLLKEAGISNT